MNEHLPASPFSAAWIRVNSELFDDDDDEMELRSLLSVYDDKSGTSVVEFKRFSATKKQRIISHDGRRKIS